jgi:hypothetical protein
MNTLWGLVSISEEPYHVLLSNKKNISLFKLIQSVKPILMHQSFDGFGSILWNSVWFLSALHSFHILFRISNFFDLGITEETWLV